jgi:predicted dehydrogenase
VTNPQKTYRVGVIGLGNMGARYLKVLHENPRYAVAWACDRNPERLAWAGEVVPNLTVGDDANDLLTRLPVDVVGVFTLADVRPHLIRLALESDAHVIAEKPLAATVAEEQELLQIIDAADRLVAVNLFNRNAWYHHFIRAFIQEGQIGQLAILDIHHQTPGLLPSEGHAPEGPPFHDCGMHYVDLARWYAGSEYGHWHAQGLRMWGHDEPWWVSAHGSFENGVVFTVTQGFTYGQMAQTPLIHSGLEAIGTLGVVRMQHDFHEVVIECHGISRTERKVGPYTGKNLDKLCQIFAASLDAGINLGFPAPRDSVVASAVSQAMLDFARQHAPPVRGTPQELQAIRQHREGLRQQRKDLVTNTAQRSR